MSSSIPRCAVSRRAGVRTAALLLTIAGALGSSACGQAEGPAGPAAPRQASEWPSYGGDPGGQRYSVLDEITPGNVHRLEVAWTYETGDVSDGSGDVRSTTAFEVTPILVAGRLFLCTPFNRVISLDPATGAEHWTFDPEIDLSGRYANQLICRGVATWLDPAGSDGDACRRRIYTATNDARLIALDAADGRPCAGFGRQGTVDLNAAAGEQRWHGEYQVTSPPAIVNGVVVVGSAISDNARVDAPSGVVRGFDARTGRERWAWDLAPPDFDRATGIQSAAGHALGTPNVWAPMSVDAERDLVFVPTGNAAPDYYRGPLAGMNYYGSSVVALRGASGEIAWHFQTVHNDLWDYDVPAQPTLTTLRRGGQDIPALIQATKMGLLFVLDRRTGEPVFGVEEREVPQQGAPGERLSPTQPFPLLPPPLVPFQLRAEDAWGVTPLDRAACSKRMQLMRNRGIYTPPTRQGSVMYPGNAGGSNWGGIAVDPERQLAVANTMDLAWAVTLIPREDFARQREENPDVEMAPMESMPFGLRREPLLSPFGLPCNPPPWGTIAAVDLETGEIRWQVPLGTIRDLLPVPLPLRMGVPNIGGPVVTRSGLIFIAATMDDYLRAIDLETGEELWSGRLPAGGQATPMTYRVEASDGASGGTQYVLIAAGGHARGGTRLGSALLAYTLDGEVE